MGTISLSAQAVLAIALAVVGGGLLVGSWFGRSRGLIVLGLVLTLSLATISALDLPLKGGTGDVTWQLTRIDQLDDGYHLRAGTAVLDLTAVEFGAEPQTVDVSLGLGELTVIVPEGVVTRVKGHLGMGDVTVFGRHQDGIGVDIDSVEPGTPQLTINARVGLADFKVRHEAS